MQTQVKLTQNGQEVQISDLNAAFAVAALADDQVLAELFRLEPYTGSTVAKGILPTGTRGGFTPYAIVNPVPGTGGVNVQPFKVLIGSRIVAGGSGGANNLKNWTDLRSQFFVGTLNDALGSLVVLAPNSSGNPRWDLLYAAVTVDGATSNLTRYVKSPTTKVVTPTSLSVSIATTVTVAAVTGTPGASPALPSIPADAGSVYYVPLAYVWVPDGWDSTGSAATNNIRDVSPQAPISRTSGAVNLRPANGNNDGAGTYATSSAFQWNTGSGVRPAPFLPPGMVGGECVLVEIDTIASPPSHVNGSVIDSSTDWRNRFFVTFFHWDPSTKFANDTTVSGGSASIPDCLGASLSTRQGHQLSQSFNRHGFGSSSCQVVGFNPQGGDLLAIEVDQTTGNLKCYINGAPAIRLFAWIMASAPMPNK